MFLNVKMSRRKQSKPNRLNEDEGDQFNGMGAKIARMENGDNEVSNVSYVDSEEGELRMVDDENDLSEEESNGFNNNNNNRLDNIEDEEEISYNFAGDIKEKLLKMTLGGVPIVDPSEQLVTVGNTIAELTGTLGKVASLPSNVQELQMLQATLLSLQQQQLLQFHILGQLRQKIAENLGQDQKVPSVKDLADKLGIQNPFVNQILENSYQELEKPQDNTDIDEPVIHEKENCADIIEFSKSPVIEAPIKPVVEQSPQPETSLSSSLTSSTPLSSSIITNHEPLIEKPVNTLELLQQKAQGILQSASKGILANNLADLSSTPYQGAGRDDCGTNMKHRCRYCGKVFGSDSALGIHIRSHTGERPYKCNVCGNRFTTKGNLKVHFSRHSDRFPVIKMNPNMVPEHVDKFYPALLQQCEEAEKKGLPMPNMNNPNAGMNPVVPPGMTLPTNLPGVLTMPNPPNSLSMAMTSVPSNTLNMPTLGGPPKMPTNLGVPPKMPLTMGALPRYPLPTEPIKKEEIFKDRPSWLKSCPLIERPPLEKTFELAERNSDFIKLEIKQEYGRPPPSMEVLLPQYPVSPQSILEHQKKEHKAHSSDEESFQDEPENLSNDKKDENVIEDRTISIAEQMRSTGLPNNLLAQFPGLPHPNLLRPPSSGPFPNSPNGLPPFLIPNVDPTKNPNLYNNILPRPGSTDSAWESLIEVDKSNETAKIESMVNNIEAKLNDPNECKICHRILSCKSALQMHYRIHTGERPFKCKICNRSFTTKGNLKTHMGVHRTKPPVRSFPQCPVCHKKFANVPVLQQHIKTHTGEKTDMTLEQIAAAEIREFPPGVPPSIPFGLPSIRPPGDPLNRLLPQFPLLPPSLPMDDEHSNDEDIHSRPSSVASSTSLGSGSLPTTSSSYNTNSFSASLAALEQHVRTIDSLAHIAENTNASHPFSRDISPELEQEDTSDLPEDLSKSSKSGLMAEEVEVPNSPYQSESDTEESISGEGEDRHQALENTSPLSTPQLDLLRPSPLLLGAPTGPLPFGQIPGFPPLPGPLFAPGLPGLPFPNPLAQLAGNLPPPPGFPGFPGLPFPNLRYPQQDMFALRGKTTCNICFKVFACNSALEIHMRSHTKERPFKCDVCGKGFTTKGNMKQHAMTHKFGDSETCSTPPNPLRSESPPHSMRHDSHISPMSSPITSNSDTISPTFGVKRSAGDDSVNLATSSEHRPPEKRAILCG